MYTQTTRRKGTKSWSVHNAISQKQSTGKTKFNFIDNRPATVAQRKLQEEMFTTSHISKKINPLQLTKKYGDSAKLARKRYRLRPKLYSFKAWKRGREAQHLIPAAVCRAYNIPEAWVNDPINGMMLPSGRTKTHHLRVKALDKGKRAHIKKGGAHPKYNRYVMGQTKTRGWKSGKVKWPMFNSLAADLRKRNRPKRKGPTKGYVEEIK